jgi:positive regulator of sigma E activity
MPDYEASVSSGGVSAILVIIWLALAILMIASFWRIFTKAGKPGWASIIPFYNIYVMLQIAGKPGWWLILYFIPLVNLIIGIIVIVALAQSFGKGAGFAVGMIFLGIIFYPILAFGDARYLGPRGAAPAPPPPEKEE